MYHPAVMSTRFGLVTVLLSLTACWESGQPVGSTVAHPSFDGEAALTLVRTQMDLAN